MPNVILDMGCGPKKTPGAIGVDRSLFQGVDVVWDLDKFPYPFEDASADRVIFRHSLEHVEDALGAVREAARILKPGGRLEVHTPHFTSMNAYSDLTHKHYFSFHAFKGLCSPDAEAFGDPKTSYEASLAQTSTGKQRRTYFRFVEGRFSFWLLHDALGFVPYRWLGVEWLANHFPVFYERFLAYWFPALEFSITLEAVKE